MLLIFGLPVAVIVMSAYDVQANLRNSESWMSLAVVDTTATPPLPVADEATRAPLKVPNYVHALNPVNDAMCEMFKVPSDRAPLEDVVACAERTDSCEYAGALRVANPNGVVHFTAVLQALAQDANFDYDPMHVFVSPDFAYTRHRHTCKPFLCEVLYMDKYTHLFYEHTPDLSVLVRDTIVFSCEAELLAHGKPPAPQWAFFWKAIATYTRPKHFGTLVKYAPSLMHMFANDEQMHHAFSGKHLDIAYDAARKHMCYAALTVNVGQHEHAGMWTTYVYVWKWLTLFLNHRGTLDECMHSCVDTVLDDAVASVGPEHVENVHSNPEFRNNLHRFVQLWSHTATTGAYANALRTGARHGVIVEEVVGRCFF